MRQVRRNTDLPILRKDFIVDELQVYQSRAAAADAILLIVAALEQRELVRLYGIARRVGLEVIVEVHSEEEICRALDGGADIVGINNRDLRTLAVTLETTERLRHLVPKGVLCIAESGVRSRQDMVRLEQLGVDAVLVGESLMASDNPATKIARLLGRTDDAR